MSRNKGDRKRLTIRLPTKLFEALKWHAEQEGISVNEYLERYLWRAL